jgi:hypothetical protein
MRAKILTINIVAVRALLLSGPATAQEPQLLTALKMVFSTHQDLQRM